MKKFRSRILEEDKARQNSKDQNPPNEAATSSVRSWVAGTHGILSGRGSAGFGYRRLSETEKTFTIGESLG